MLFNSLDYLIFFPCVLALYFLLPNRFRWPMLLLASLYFYMAWKPEYVLLILICILVNYAAGLLLEQIDNSTSRKLILTAALTLSLGLLFYFKYAGFIAYNIQRVFEYIGLSYPVGEFSVILPVGISFFTFQALSYTIDVYRRKIRRGAAHWLFFFVCDVLPPVSSRADYARRQFDSSASRKTRFYSSGCYHWIEAHFMGTVYENDGSR